MTASYQRLEATSPVHQETKQEDQIEKFLQTVQETKPEDQIEKFLQTVSITHDRSAALQKTFPWLAGDDDFQIELRDLLIKDENQWVVELLETVPELKKWQFCSKQTLAIVLGIVLAATQIGFYYEGTLEDGAFYLASALIVNIPQIIAFTKESFFFFMSPGDWINLLVGGGLGLAATGANGIAAYALAMKDPNLSQSEKIGVAALTALGNLPMNVAGMAEVVQDVRQKKQRDPKLTQFWLDKLQKATAELKYSPALKNCVVEPKRNGLTKFSAGTLGLGLGFGMAGGMAGYVYSTFTGALNFASKEMSMVISGLANGPSIVIALVRSGFKTGKSLVYNAADGLHFLASNSKMVLSSRQSRFMLMQLAAIAAMGYWAYPSNKTSMKLAEGMPSFQEYFDAFIKFCIEKEINGVSLFNWITSVGVATYPLINYFNQAYEKDPQLVAQNRFSAVKEYVQSAPGKVLNALHLKHFGQFRPKALPAPKNEEAELKQSLTSDIEMGAPPSP